MRLGVGKPEVCLEEMKNKIEGLKDNDVEIYMFPQCWGSGALGFSDRIGASVLTQAYTIVITIPSKLKAGVFFNNEFAYMVNSYGNKFIDDIHNHLMLPQHESERYEVEKKKKINFSEMEKI